MQKDSVWLPELHNVEAKLNWGLTWEKCEHREQGIEGIEKDDYINLEDTTLLKTFIMPEFCSKSVSRAYAEAGQSHLVLWVLIQVIRGSTALDKFLIL